MTVYNFTIKQGTTETLVFRALDSDGDVVVLTDCTAEAQFREEHDSDDALISLSSEGASPGLVITALTGLVTMTLTAPQTAALDAPAKLVYDVFVTFSDGTTVLCVAEGVAVVSPGATR